MIMLRTVVITVAAILLCVGVGLIACGVYAPGWQPTGERCEDPETGRTVQVYYDPRSGARRYVSDSEPAP